MGCDDACVLVLCACVKERRLCEWEGNGREEEDKKGVQSEAR